MASIPVGDLGDLHLGSFRVFEHEPSDYFERGAVHTSAAEHASESPLLGLERAEDDAIRYIRGLPLHGPARYSPEGPLHCLAYVSTCTRRPSAEDLMKLRDAAARRNAEYRITGFLVYDAGHFMQYIEGPPAHLELVYWIIRKDPFHRDIVKLFRRTAENRVLPDWAMAFDAGPRDAWATAGMQPMLASMAESPVRTMFDDFVNRSRQL